VVNCGLKWEEVELTTRSAGSTGVLHIKRKLEQMFFGQHRHILDTKSRLTVPADYRELLVDGAYVMQGLDRNLIVLPEDVFKAISHDIDQMNVNDPLARLLRRLIYSTASRVVFDRTGRMLIPQFLRQYAGLDGEVVLAGAGNYIEIWAPAQWDLQLNQMQDTEANAQRFAPLVISTTKS